MPDEPNPETPSAEAPPPAAETPVLNMLEVLGYYADDKKQEAVPKPEAGEETPEGEAKPEGETPAGQEKPAGEEPTPDGGEKPAAPKSTVTERARKVKVEKPAATSEPVTKEELVEAVKEAIKPTEPAKPDPLAKYGELLLPEKRALELAQFAAAAMPEKYKDMEAKEVAWITKNREFIQKQMDEHGEFSADTEEYRELVRRHKPAYQQGDREELFLMRAESRAEAKAAEKFKVQLAERDRRINEMEARPIIQKTLETVEADILAVLEKPIAEAFKADPKKALETYGIEAPLTMAIITDTQHNVREYIALAKGVRDYNKDDPVHVNLVQFIKTQGQFLEKIPEDKRVRDGKVLVSRERWATLPKSDRPKYMTFTDGDIVDMMAVGGRNYLQATIKAEYARLEKAGFKRGEKPVTPPPAKPNAPAGEKKEVVTPPAAKPAVKPSAPQAPKGGATPAPGSSTGVKPVTKSGEPAVLAALGYDKV